MAERPPLDFRAAADSFDAEWYRDAYPEVAATDDPAVLAHYVEAGAREGRRPNRDFDPDWYLERYPKVAREIAAGRLCGPYHDYLLRRRQELPRRPAPAAVSVAMDLSQAAPAAVELVIALADRAPGWDFCLLAPSGHLPAGALAANTILVPSVDRLPPVDLWLDLAPGQLSSTMPQGLIAAPGQTMKLPHDPADRSSAALDRTLESLREALLSSCPLVPVARCASGPVHLDPDRVSGLHIVVRRLDAGWSGGGVVLRADTVGTVAELPPPGDAPLETVVDVRGVGSLRMTVSPGVLVELAPAAVPGDRIDVIVTARAGTSHRSWQRTLDAAAAMRPAGRLLTVDAPVRLAMPAGVENHSSLADALTLRSRPALLLPVGVRPFPQAAGQALSLLAAGRRSCTVRSAIRHPDGHLACYPDLPGPAARDQAIFWRHGQVTVLSAAGRRQAARRLAAGGSWTPAEAKATSLAAIDAGARPPRLQRQPKRGPKWLQLDACPDGAVLGRLRLRGAHLADGGSLVLTGHTDGALAAPCRVAARSATPGAGDIVIARFRLPESGSFAWPIELPEGVDATNTIEIRPDGAWLTAQDTRDPRPVLFRLDAVFYRPPAAASMSPSAISRSR